LLGVWEGGREGVTGVSEGRSKEGKELEGLVMEGAMQIRDE
jgi:hypothetical protein